VSARARRAGGACALYVCLACAANAAGIESIYDTADLAQRQQLYPKFVLGVLDAEIRPRLTADERAKLASLRFAFPLVMSGWEPFGFRSDGQSVEVSIASLKLLNDLLLAYAWLGRHGYSPSTVDDYMALLVNWRKDEPPPPPLATLGVPPGARDEADTDRLATLLTRSAYLFIVLHEMGHVLHDDRPAAGLTLQAMQAREAAADAFAIDLMARMGVVPTGIAEFFQLAAASMPSPAAYRDDAAYLDALRRQTHPVTAERLAAVARAIEAHAQSFAVDQQPQTLAQFAELSRLLRKASAMMLDPDLRRMAAERGAKLQPRDLAPRKAGTLP
jgi:hypothetical protein